MKRLANQKEREIWFLTGSQHLYGPETLTRVAENSQRIAASLQESGQLPARVVWKPVLTDPDAIRDVCMAASSAPECVGVITWMHTFSPAKMWIAGLTRLQKPLAHLHTQFNRELPWGEIDMDFMNLNQSAHGVRVHRRPFAYGSHHRRRSLARRGGAGGACGLGSKRARSRRVA
jgi:L-arabinose isomerase